MAYFRNLFGGQSEGVRDNDNAAEIVERLVERVDTSTAFEDRRDALKTLRSLAKKMRLPVATIGMTVYLSILEKERGTPEIVAIALDILVAVVSEDEESDDGADELGERLSEMIVRKKGFISSILSLVECYEFNVRRAVVQLLCALLRHRANEVQTAIINEPMGVSRLVDLLHDTREVVRNNAVLMLCELSRANSQIQQLLAYENTFQLIFDIIEVEPAESIVIEDCLFVILNLLRKNASNQQLFREASLVQRLAILLHSFLFGHEEDDEAERGAEWAKQKIANVIFLLQVVRSLVSPHENSQANIHAAQKAINQTGMLNELCGVLLSEMGVGAEVLTEAIVAVAECIRGNYTNQEYFASRSLATTAGNRSSLLVLLISMTTDKQPLKLRCAVFFCFLSYLYDNEFGKTKVIDTLLPSGSTGDAQLTTGQCICSAIMSTEGIQVWMGCVCLMHCLLDAEHLKQQLLRVQLSTSTSQQPSSLLQHLGALLISLGNRKPQIRVGLLMLLSVWLHNCPLAISQFLQVDDNIQYLTTHIDECGAEGSEGENQAAKGLMAFLLAICLMYGEGSADSKNSLSMIVERRVGKEKVVELLEGISHCEHYVRAAQRPQPLAKAANELLFDYQFTKLFKVLEGQMVKHFRPLGDPSSAQVNGSGENVVASYKELIKRQDATIADLNQQMKKLTNELSVCSTAAKEQCEHELAALREELSEKCRIEQERNAVESPQLEHYKRITSQWQLEVERYQQWAQQWAKFQISQLPNPQEAVVLEMSAQLKALDEQLTYGWKAYEELSSSSAANLSKLAEADLRIQSLEKSLAAAVKQNEESARELAKLKGHEQLNKSSEGEELASLKKEQEDLLVLLADQDTKISQYRKRLIEVGQTVTDDEDEAEA